MSYIFHSFNIWHKRRRQRFLPHFLFFFFRYIFFSYYRFHETDEYVYRVEDSAGRPCTGDQARTPQHKAIIDDLVFRRHAKIVCVLEARWHSCDFTKIKSSKFYSTKIWKIGGTLWRTELSILRALKCCWKWSFTSYITSRVTSPQGQCPHVRPLIWDAINPFFTGKINKKNCWWIVFFFECRELPVYYQHLNLFLTMFLSFFL